MELIFFNSMESILTFYMHHHMSQHNLLIIPHFAYRSAMFPLSYITFPYTHRFLSGLFDSFSQAVALC